MSSVTSLGILQYTTNEYNEYLNRVAAACAENGIYVFRFNPLDYDDKTEKATGLVYDPQNKTWLKGCFSLPEFIYDRIYYPPNQRKAIKQTQKHVHLIKKKAQFLGTGLPNKWVVYQWLTENEQLKPFLPPTDLLTPDSLNRYLNTYNKVALKPVFGSGGYGFFAIEKKGTNNFIIENGEKTKEYNWTKDGYSLYQFLTDKLIGQKYLIQPLLPLMKDGAPFDLRIVLQKLDGSRWKLTGKGFRIGKKGSYLSNLQAGGRIAATLNISKQTARRIKKLLPQLIDQIPKHMEQFHTPLFELGIDIGISEDGRIWLLEVNSKPGYETVMTTGDNSGKQYKGKGPVTWILANKKSTGLQKNPMGKVLQVKE